MSRLRLLAAFGLATLIVTATVAQEKKDPPKTEAKKDEKAAPAPAPADGGLVAKYTKDVPFFQELTTKTTQNIKVQGLDIGQNQEQTFWFKFLPIKQDGDKWVIQQTIEGVKMKIDIAGNPVSFNSQDEATASGTNTALSEFFKALKGSQFTLTIAKDGTVEKVEGREEFVKKLISANKQLESLLNKILGEEAMKQMADPTFGVIPKEGGKKKGDKWTRTVKLNLGPLGVYENTYTFTFKDQKGDIADIDVAVAIAYTAPSADQGDALPFKIKEGKLTQDTDPKAKNGGTVQFNVKTGRVEASEISVKLSGQLKLDIGGTVTDVNLTQEQTTTLKTQDKTFIAEKKS